MKFVIKHWFGFFVSIVALFCILIFVLVLASPKQDAQKRGFVICTEGFVEDARGCAGAYGCLIKYVFVHGYCNASVVLGGAKNWVLGKQETPWSNYMFNPEYLENEEIDEELQQFYHENPNLTEQMNVFRNKSKELDTDGEE